ncbi:MAG: hypothetical protein KGH55_01570 [Nanoarchaeota archaeon]|nr:hypothetical protein [Nanoarchaeota archaeon]
MSWESENKLLLDKMNEWRKTYICNHDCEEWRKFQYCHHLRNAMAKKFAKEIEVQIISLAELNPTIAVEPSQSLTIS